ncbi:hydrogenase iron-sulfur subunit [Chloroflexota bacterium]
MSAEVLVFACNWDGWSCVESANNLGLNYPASVKVVRVSCLSRLHTGLILKAFEFGADGVMLLGCEPGHCQFGTDSENITVEYEKARAVLEMLGIWKDRLVLVRQPAFDGREFVRRVTEFMAHITRAPAARTVAPLTATDSVVRSLT